MSNNNYLRLNILIIIIKPTQGRFNSKPITVTIINLSLHDLYVFHKI